MNNQDRYVVAIVKNGKDPVFLHTKCATGPMLVSEVREAKLTADHMQARWMPQQDALDIAAWEQYRHADLAVVMGVPAEKSETPEGIAYIKAEAERIRSNRMARLANQK